MCFVKLAIVNRNELVQGKDRDYVQFVLCCCRLVLT